MEECNHELHDWWFDRTICPEPCGMMHMRCDVCGCPLEHCSFFEEDSAQS